MVYNIYNCSGPINVTNQIKIQQKAARMVNCILYIRHLEYEERLKVLKLPSLSYRIYRGDIIAVYNIPYGKYNMDYSDFLIFFNNYPLPEIRAEVI